MRFFIAILRSTVAFHVYAVIMKRRPLYYFDVMMRSEVGDDQTGRRLESGGEVL